MGREAKNFDSRYKADGTLIKGLIACRACGRICVKDLTDDGLCRGCKAKNRSDNIE